MITPWHAANRIRGRRLTQPIGLFHWPLLTAAFPTNETIRNRMNQLFDDYDSGVANAAGATFRLYEEEDELVVTVDVPGYSADALDLELIVDTLTISGHRAVEDGPEGYERLRQERTQASFSHTVSLPAPVDPERIVANLANGVLTIRLAKADELRPRRISVQDK